MSRNTRQKQAIRQALVRADGPLTAQEILDAAEAESPGLGIATVYRNVNDMVERGELVPVRLPGQTVRYEPSGKGHHHHFYCRRCGRVFETQRCLSEWPSLAPAGFLPETHDIILYGTCRDCAG